ncbi:hypothetical protein [Boudabousia liubingyangii]|uniref:hypothetical protein n=1 Tax=Boudabousia liubingyangii TaxID=1921764 RepID=UPI001177C4FC|nr:hypothetical protein [Boudabousia liubingyangii]
MSWYTDHAWWALIVAVLSGGGNFYWNWKNSKNSAKPKYAFEIYQAKKAVFPEKTWILKNTGSKPAIGIEIFLSPGFFPEGWEYPIERFPNEPTDLYPGEFLTFGMGKYGEWTPKVDLRSRMLYPSRLLVSCKGLKKPLTVAVSLPVVGD